MNRRSLGRPAAPLLVLATLTACGSSTSPGPSDPTHDLLFQGDLAGIPELLLLGDDGGVRRVLPAGTIATDPQPSPDGEWVAFVVADYDDFTGDIFVVRRDGSGLAQLTSAPELDDQPSWSPDGARIVFRSYRTQRDGDIWVMDADGGNPVLLTPDPLPGVTNESHPAWSPAGDLIAYISNAGGNLDLWTMAADGSDSRRITNTMDLDAEPAWSPDGRTIAFRRTTAQEWDIWLVEVDGASPRALALPGIQRMPTWAPDGERLVVVSHGSLTERPDLYGVAADGTDLRPLVTEAVPGGCLHPAFLRRP